MDRISQVRQFWNDSPCDGQATYVDRCNFRYRKDAWLLPLLDGIASRSPRAVLEVGCGQGTDGVTLCQMLPAGSRYVGVDMSDVSLTQARGAAVEASAAL